MDERELEERRQLNQGFGAALNNAFEIAVIPAIFGGFGWLADSAFGTWPVFTAVFAILGLVGTFTKLYYGYNRKMLSLENAGPWKRTTGAPQ